MKMRTNSLNCHFWPQDFQKNNFLTYFLSLKNQPTFWSLNAWSNFSKVPVNFVEAPCGAVQRVLRKSQKDASYEGNKKASWDGWATLWSLTFIPDL